MLKMRRAQGKGGKELVLAVPHLAPATGKLREQSSSKRGCPPTWVAPGFNAETATPEELLVGLGGAQIPCPLAKGTRAW